MMNSRHFAESMEMIREYVYWMQDHSEDWNEDIEAKVYMPIAKMVDKPGSTNAIEAMQMVLALGLASSVGWL